MRIKKNKKAMAAETLIKLIIIIVIFAVIAFALTFLLKRLGVW